MRILLSILLLLALLPDYSGEARRRLLPADLHLRAEPVELDWRDPARKRLGALTFLGGVRLISPSWEFGGISSMAIASDRFTLLTDGGDVVRLRLDAQWRISDVRASPLPDGPGRGWSKLDRDSESLAHDPITGRYWAGFERANQIWRYSPGLARAEAHVAPRGMAKWSSNGGAEALVRLRDGSFVVFSESARVGETGVRRALWFAGDPTRRPRAFGFGYRPPRGFKPTDAAELPDGRLVVINRRFSIVDAFTAVVTLVERDAIRPGRIVQGREIARFAAPVLHDNFEGVAAVREGRDTILWFASDDNQWIFQRTLLLKFRLHEGQGRKRRTARVP